ncbi:MAG: Sua5/YciO/YrdC/YwlC family protein [Dysgonamonadaceae bacterium]|jgi:L-threonylcarbamoyladenylate synthase|nr:Sua5/YciO/YrdC/YwlC family protein [Dysgonamonadaceae bacterium]
MQDEIKKACETLKQGGIILFPTDTSWGVGCDATNEAAVEKIFTITQSSDKKTIVALLDNPIKLQQYISNVPEIAWDLIELADKPLTIIYDGAKSLAQNLIAEDGSVGIRITNERFSNALCKQFRQPIAFAYLKINPEIKKQVDYVVDYGKIKDSEIIQPGIIKLKNDGTIIVIQK